MKDEESVLVIDPPWPQRKGGKRSVRPNQGRALPYNTLQLPDIIPVTRTLAPLDTATTVFVWAIDRWLHEAEELFTAEGFRLHARMVWDKGNGVAPAFTVRFAHEYVLWMYRSPMPQIAVSMRGKFTTVIRERSRAHSQKPDVFYELVEDLYPDAIKYDVFARGQRVDWKAVGDEADSTS